MDKSNLQLIKENEELRKELAKERSLNNRLRESWANCNKTNSLILRQVDELQHTCKRIIMRTGEFKDQ